MPALPPILLVDDNPDDLLILRRILARTDVKNKVVAFEDALGAVDYLELEAKNGNPLFIPCAIVTDLNMPGKDGCELTRWVRAHPTLRDIRIILVSDSDDPTDQQRSLAAGVTHFRKKYPIAQVMAELLADLPCIAEEKDDIKPKRPR